MAREDLNEAQRRKQAGDLDGAVLAIEAVLEGRRAHPAALTQLAEVQLRRGRLEEAEEALDRAEDTAGTTAASARLRGDVRYRRKQWGEAARCYQDADALGDRGIWALVQLGRCRMRLGDTDGARGAAARAVERDGAASPAWVLLGDLARRDEHLEDAESMYARAHDVAPGDQWAYAKLVETRLLALPEDRRARQVEVLLKSSGRDNRHLLGVLARLRSERGDEEQAANDWATAAHQHGDRFARKMQGFALRRAGKLDEAAAVLGSCVLEDPQDLVLFRTYVHLQRSRGALEELRGTLEDLIPRAGSRRGAVYGELKKLPPPPAVPEPEAGIGDSR
ncbi:MAG: tetratricopeptide repeat protein [Actinomycetota bacterium]|nr:tetratricopeptide repeat protein [Actinomycetota bacterium]